MTEQQSKITAMLSGAVSRREVLKGGLVASSAAFLAACGAAQTSPPPASAPASVAPGSEAPSESPSASAVSYAGVTLQAHTGGYSIPAYQIGLDAWKAETGGDAVFTNIPFDEKPVKIAGMIATQDSSWDLQYTY